ncbi:MAG: hypothetical protein D6775_16200 [Caldilineae bacterium]|nr:MAG: hypothetical protein D6775_16200 [Caldilineae bacterium]
MTSSFPDPRTFILETTDRVWNRKQIGELYHRAYSNVRVHGPSGRSCHGREAWMADILSWLGAFPDVQVTCEHLIVNGEAADAWVAEQRLLSGHHLNPSIYGLPTGRSFSIRAHLLYRVIQGRIREVWQEVDEVGLLRQLGLDPLQVLEQLETYYGLPCPRDGAWQPVGEAERTRGQLPPPALPPLPDPFAVDRFLRRCYDAIWNWRLVGEVENLYAPQAEEYGWGEPRHGVQAIRSWVLERLNMLPDLTVSIDRTVWEGDGRRGYHVAALWTLVGTHAGPAYWGPPSLHRLRLQGISHHYIRRHRIQKTWMSVGELGLVQHIAPRPSAEPPPTPASQDAGPIETNP